MESALSSELRLPAHFEAVAQLVTEDAVEGFLRFYEREVLPKLGRLRAAA